jgi:hypothetical protein
VAHTSAQKIVGWLDPIQVSAEGRGLLLRTPFGDQRYVQTGPGTFEQADGEWSVVFHEKGGESRLFMGPIPLAYFEVPWYRTLGFQLPLLVACLALFASALIVVPAAFLVRRWRGNAAAPSRLANAARWLAASTDVLNLALAVWFVLSVLGFPETYVWPTGAVSTITRLWLLSLPLTLVIVILAVLAWKNCFWNVVGRVHYTLVAFAAVLFVMFLLDWNLVGP